ncbi:hypothetical protein OMP94_01115 [Methylophaga sp. OBS3]|nr:hypothetical protein [Methylophaga sp. OBS3]
MTLFKALTFLNKAEPLVLSALLLLSTAVVSLFMHTASGDAEVVNESVSIEVQAVRSSLFDTVIDNQLDGEQGPQYVSAGQYY